jgi:hypothetical protein
VGCVPRWTVSPQLHSGQLISVRLGRGLRWHWGVATRRSAPRTQVLDDFITLLSQIDPSDAAH